MRRGVWMLVCSLGFWAGSTWARELSLEEAMRLARERQATVQAAKAEEEAAAHRVNQAKGFRLPSLRFDEVFIRTDSPAEAFALKLNQERFSFASFMTTDPNRPKKLDTAISRFELQLPVYTGGELSSRIAQAQRFAESKTLARQWAERQAALAAAEAYVMLAQAQEYVALLQKARDTVAAHVALAKAYVDQGMLVEAEYLRAQVELSRLEDLLAQAKGQEEVAQANLAFRLGLEQTERFEIKPLALPAGPAGGLEEYLATAEARPDVRGAEAMVKAAELEAQVKKAAFLPKAGIVARADWVDDTPFGTHGDSTTVMAVVGANLFAGGSDRAAVAAARAEARAGREQVRFARQGVALEVRQAYVEAQVAVARVATARKALQAAAEVERVTTERFRQGVVKMIDLLDADTARREAETRELVARAEAHLALLRLAIKAGREPESALQ
ncbi:MAG: transporter [Thermoanaerobaculum sp.]|uniref:TolC family protein n=2 Tax=Thermoanaerobaculum aquaticum TaxID=1312852 RepID=A0A7C2NP48_9BACT|nr:MAG: transporter [Thermoanaerobaculum sp.]